MSLAVLTDSTTAQASPAFTDFPLAGNSTKTTSVNSCCAWSVMPTVAVSSLIRTHSCDFAYFKSVGTFDIRALSQGGAMASTWFSIKWFGDHHRGIALAPNFNLQRRGSLGGFRGNIAKANRLAERGALSPTDDYPQRTRLGAAAPNPVLRTRRRRTSGHFKSNQFFGDTLGLLFRQYRLPDEVLRQRDKKAEARFDGGGVLI